MPERRSPAPGADRATGAAPRPRLLLIGPLPIAGDQVGGAKVLFRRLVQDLREADEVELVVINSSRPRGGRGRLVRTLIDLRASASVLARVAARGRGCDAWAINLSAGGAFGLLPAVAALAALLRRPLGLRVFGGGLGRVWDGASGPSRGTFERVARRCTFVALETRELVERFDRLGNVRWFPNTRDIETPPIDRRRCAKLLYLGQIREEKGSAYLLEAMGSVPAGTSLSLYGSPVDRALLDRAIATGGVSYGGEVDAAEIPAILGEHDALVLPTVWHGEGMPGVVIEAFQCGLPAVATRWMRSPELVVDGTNGLLVEPRSAAALAAAVRRLVAEPATYRALGAGAVDTGNRFRSPVWSARFARWCLA